MPYTLTIAGNPELINERTKLYFRVVEGLLEAGLTRAQLEKLGCEFFNVEETNQPENWIQLILERPDVGPSKRDPNRYSISENMGYHAFNIEGIYYILYNQDSLGRLIDLQETAEQRGITWAENNPAIVQNPPENQNDDEQSRENNKPLKLSPNVIFYGPPGTGKTYTTIPVAARLVAQSNDVAKSWDELVKNAVGLTDEEREKQRDSFSKALGKRIHFITFHQSYSYEDFIGGLRPVTTAAKGDAKGETEAGNLKFTWQPGIFLRACAAAFKEAKRSDPKLSRKKSEESGDDNDVNEFLNFCSSDDWSTFNDINPPPVVLVIDEINRANMSRVFGELITLLEDDKRLGGKEQLIVQLPNNPTRKFGVPKNLIIIGTMNTADKSLALLDLALRRRFEFIRLDPNPERVICLKFSTFLTRLNDAIADEKTSFDYGIGHAFFMGVDINKNLEPEKCTTILEGILQRKIVPLLQEYFGGDDAKVIQVIGKAGVKLETVPISNGQENRKKSLIKNPVKIDGDWTTPTNQAN
jgi:DNA polymerase III delta prime subunit